MSPRESPNMSVLYRTQLVYVWAIKTILVAGASREGAGQRRRCILNMESVSLNQRGMRLAEQLIYDQTLQV